MASKGFHSPPQSSRLISYTTAPTLSKLCSTGFCPFLQSPRPFPARIFSHACSLYSSSLLAWSTASHPSTLSLVSPPSPSFEIPLLWSLQSSAKVPATLTTLLKMTTSCLLFHNPSTLHFSPGIYRFPGHHKIYLLNMFIVYFLLQSISTRRAGTFVWFTPVAPAPSTMPGSVPSFVALVSLWT